MKNRPGVTAAFCFLCLCLNSYQAFGLSVNGCVIEPFTVCVDAQLQSADLISTELSGAVLTGADLKGSLLSGVDLSSANLSGADLTNAKLFGADLSNVILFQAKLVAANLGLFPGTGEPGGSLMQHPYRLSMAIVGLGLATYLGVWSARLGGRTGNWLLGLALLAGSGVITGVALAFVPSILFPNDQYPVTFGWTIAGGPVGLLSWLAVTVADRLRGEGTTAPA